MILENIVLVRCDIGVICVSSCLMSSCGLEDLRLFIVWCMWTLAVAIYGGRSLLIRLVVKFVHVVK